ncbi:hypothetical protein FRC11_004194, partial [Ceratobasidium sp. 423]
YAKKGTDRISYFAEGGEYEQKVVKTSFPHRVVFLCTFTCIGAETGNTLSRAPTGAAGRESRFRGEPPPISTNNAPDSTIFAKEFLFFACDELHQLRNATSCQDGATRLACNSLVRSGATASPVFTGSKDAIAAAVILRILDVIGDEGYTLGYELLESQRARLKEWKARQPNLVVPASSSTSNPEVSQHQPTHHEIANKLLKEGDLQGYKAFFVQQPSIERIRKILIPYIVRRTSKSRMPDGRLILNIPDFVESIVWIAINELEKEALLDIYRRLMSEKPQGLQGEMLLCWDSFLMDYKHVLFHYLMRSETLSVIDPFWKKWTLSNLRQMASTKLLVTFDLIEHYKNPAAQPLFFNRDGTRDYDKEANFVPPPSPQVPDKPRKMLIFIMYDRHGQVTKFSLDLLGYKYLEYNGTKTDVERDQAVREFEARDDVYVMLLSNVGTTGLNLTMASVIIFLSGLWSGMETKQTIGRCWRPGQLFVVHVYHILAPDTADEILSSYATSKTIMENRFFAQEKELATKIFHREDETDSEESDIDAPSAPSTRSAVVPRALKGQKRTVGAIEPAQSTKKQAKATKRKTPASSKPAKRSAEQGAGGRRLKRRKVLEQGSDDVSPQPQPSLVVQPTQAPLLEAKSTPIPVSQSDAATIPSRPRARPKMRPPPGAQDSEATTTNAPPIPGPEPVVGSAPSNTGPTPVASTSSLPPPPAPLAHPSNSTDPSLANPSLNALPDDSSIPALNAMQLDIPPASSSTPEALSEKPTAPFPVELVAHEDPPMPSASLRLTPEGTLNPGAPSSGVSIEHELSSYDDPDVDVAGNTDKSNHPDEHMHGGEYHIDRHSTQPTPVVEPSSVSEIASKVNALTVSKTGISEGPESGAGSIPQEGSFPDEDSLMSAFLEHKIDSLDRNLIRPPQTNQPEAQSKMASRIPSVPVSNADPSAKTWRSSTSSRSSAKVTVPRGSQSNSNASAPSRRRDVVPHSNSQLSQGHLGDGSQGCNPMPSSSSQKHIAGSEAFKDVSEAEVPKVLSRNRKAVMEQVDHASQTGAIKLHSSQRVRSTLPSEGISRQTVHSPDIASHSKGNAYRSFHLGPKNHGAP